MTLEGRHVLNMSEQDRPGDYSFAGRDFLDSHMDHDPSEYVALTFRCPKCGAEHALTINREGGFDSQKGWAWNGSVDKPTLDPSILIQSHGAIVGCGWHGYLRNGAWESV